MRRFKKLISAVIWPALLGAFVGVTSFSTPIIYNDYIISHFGDRVLKITSLQQPNAGGTGFLVQDEKGQTKILTNAHICHYLEGKIGTATLRDRNQPTLVYVEKIDERHDLCLLSGVFGVKGLELADKLTLGQKVNVLGHPLLDPITLSQGYIISNAITAIPDANIDLKKCVGPGRQVQEVLDFIFLVKVCMHYENSYITDARIYPGNSGSPVLDSWGNVIGIIFASDTMTYKGRFVGLDEVKEFLKP